MVVTARGVGSCVLATDDSGFLHVVTQGPLEVVRRSITGKETEMKGWKRGNGNQASTDLTMPTSGEMESIGGREGRDSFRRFSLFSRGTQDPVPARDDPRLPSAVRKAQGACRQEAARLADAYHSHSIRLAQQIAADNQTVESLGCQVLPSEEKVLPAWIHGLTLGLLFVAEWIVNALAFAVFGGSNLQTYVVALVVAVLIPFCASVVGSAWKQRRHDGVAMLALLVAMGLIIAVALVRQAYFYDVVNSILGLNIAPWLLMVIYVVINLAMFGGGVLVSYRHAQSDPEGQNARFRLEAARERLTANLAAQHGLRGRYLAQAEDLGPQLQTMAWAYDSGNMRARRRARRPEHREQPIWVDGIESLVVSIPDALLSRPEESIDGTSFMGTPAVAAACPGHNGNGQSRTDPRVSDASRTAANARRAKSRRQSGTTSSTAGSRVLFKTYSAKETHE